jgi:hypothetical protein
MEKARALPILADSREETTMSRMCPQSAVGIALDRAVLCPNDETVYDAERWVVCPTCVNKEGMSLSRILGGAASMGSRGKSGHAREYGEAILASGLLARAPFLHNEH